MLIELKSLKDCWKLRVVVYIYGLRRLRQDCKFEMSVRNGTGEFECYSEAIWVYGIVYLLTQYL